MKSHRMGNIIKSNTKIISSNFFKKSHELVFSQLSLTPIQHDIFALFLARIEKENWDNYKNNGDLKDVPSYEFNNDLLSDWFQTAKIDLYSTLKKPCQMLASVSIGIPMEKKGDFQYRPLFSDITYKGGVLTLTPNYKLVDVFVGASNGYSLISHKEFRDLNLESSKRLYTILSRWRSFGRLHPFSLTELHGIFGLLDERGKLKKKTYEITANFILRIIKPAIKEISERDKNIKFLIDSQTGNFGFKYTKEGRKISGLEFLFSWRTSATKSVKTVNEFTYFDAVSTYKDIMSGIDIEYTEDTLDYALKMIGEMMLDKNLDFEVDAGAFISKVITLKSNITSEH